MQNNYVKNKLLFSLSACAILLGLSNSSALAQQKYPTEAQIQQAKVNLRQQVQSVKNRGLGNYIEDGRTPEQIQNREKFVSAWQQVEPGIAPFLGSWGDYEGSWSINPSTVKHQVCVVKVIDGFAELYVGKINNGNIHLSSGSVIFPEGKYLGVTSFQNQLSSDLPLNNPTVPTEPSPSDKYIDEILYPSSLLQAYKQAGCTASLPTQNTASTQTKLVKADPDPALKPILGDIQRQLPKGWSMRLPSTLYMTDYQGNRVEIYPRFENQFDNGVAIFLDTQPNCEARACYFGNITMAKEHDEYNENLLTSPIFSIEKLKQVWQAREKPYETRTEAEMQLMMESEMAVLSREKITLAPGVEGHYIVRNSAGASTPSGGAVIWEQDGFVYSVRGPGWIEEEYKRWKTELIDIARSMASEPSIQNAEQYNSTVSQKTNTVRMPDSIKLTLEHKGTNTKTEFIKRDDGYYTWFVKKEGFLSSLTTSLFDSLANNTSGTCLGLKENQDLAKVRLAKYRCDSQEEARKWEILMVNNNTGYKIKLPNTKYCLGANVGVFDCDNPDIPVENLTPEQLKSWFIEQ
ncbi:MAG: hypothetical protein ACRC2S_23385 [Waterburya sp.]